MPPLLPFRPKTKPPTVRPPATVVLDVEDCLSFVRRYRANVARIQAALEEVLSVSPSRAIAEHLDDLRVLSGELQETEAAFAEWL